MPLTLNVLGLDRPGLDGIVTRISTTANGTVGNGSNSAPQLTADGHGVFFLSNATNYTSTPVTGQQHLYHKDLQTGAVSLVSVNPAKTAADAEIDSFHAAADGSRVAFGSAASNLVLSDLGGYRDIFVRSFGNESLVSLTFGGLGDSFDPVMSANGQFVVFKSNADNLVAGDGNGKTDLFIKDMSKPGLVRLQGPSNALDYRISDDGQSLIFSTNAALVAGDVNNQFDVYRMNIASSTFERLSVNARSEEAIGGSSVGGRVSADGAYLVFESRARNLVAGDTNDRQDIFRKDLRSGEVIRVSLSGSVQGDGDSSDARISADGRYVTFSSAATNLVANDTNQATDLFRKDLVTGILERISVSVLPAQGKVQANGDSSTPWTSGDGRYTVFTSAADNLAPDDRNHVGDVLRRDLATGEIIRVSSGPAGEANAASGNAHTSQDGQVVAFESRATNLLPTAAAGYNNVFVRDLLTGDLVQASATADKSIGGNADSFNARLSADGTRVAFESRAGNLAAGDFNGWSDIFVRDMSTPAHTLVRVSTGAGGLQAEGNSVAPDMSADGSWVVFESDAPNLVAGDTRGQRDVFLKNAGNPDSAPIRVSLGLGNVEGDGASYGAKVNVRGSAIDVVFTSQASNLLGPGGDTNGFSDVYVYRTSDTGTSLVRVSTGAFEQQAGAASSDAQISGNGRYVVFRSGAQNLVPNPGGGNPPSSIFVKDLDHLDQAPILVSAGNNGPGNSTSYDPRISADGRFVTFTSYASNLVAGDGNDRPDIFRKDLQTGSIERLSVSSADAHGLQQPNLGSVNGGMSDDARLVVLASQSSNIVAGDGLYRTDLFLVDAGRAGDVEAFHNGRVVAVRLGVGAASSVDIAWGDGTAETVTPSGGVASLSHIFADKGTKDALVTVHEGAQAWAVHHTLDVAAGTLVRNTALADTLTGGEAADALTGDGFANLLVGKGGNDTLDGAGGADTLQGGAGDDTYRIDSTADVIVEAAGGGSDTAIVSLDFNMGALANVETIKLADGTVATRVTGGAGNDHLIGNTNFNIIDGAGGADTMEGGTGSDVFLVDNAADLVVEAAGGGRDAVQAGVSYALSAGAEVEVMTALGAGAIALTGSNSANTIHGNAGANVLKGLAGNDVLHGGAGRDQLWGGIGRDTFVFDTRPNTRANPDKVRDFSVRDDSIWLDNAVMPKLGRRGSESNPVKLNKAFFALDTAKDGNDHVIYKKSTGVLYYDPDGNGARAAVQLATLSKNLKIKATDFFVV